MINNPANSILRIQGMASGLDTDSMVKSLMFAEQLKVKRVEQQKIKLEWKSLAQQEIRSRVAEFRSKVMSVLSPETNMSSASAFNTKSINFLTSDPSVNITASGLALNGSYTIDSVDAIAKGANIQSGDSIIVDTSINLNTKLTDIAFSTPLEFGGENSDTISFKINGKEFVFNNTSTLSNVINTVNSSQSGARLTYSELTGKFDLTNVVTGSQSKLEIENLAGNFFGAASVTAINAGIYENGQDAILSINGIQVTRSTNNFTIDGLNYSILATTNTPVKYSVQTDIEPAVDRIKEFVKLYNDLIEELEKKLNEEEHRNFSPLVESDKEDLSDKEVEIWEEKAKSGLLRGDRQISMILRDLRSMLYDTVSGLGKSISQIGFETGFYRDGGKINLNESKLRTALSSNPDEVMDLFIREGTSADKSQKYQESGFMVKMRDKFISFQGSFNVVKSVQEIASVSIRINMMNDQLINKENYYYQRFAAMEKSLAMMQSQSAWISQQLS